MYPPCVDPCPYVYGPIRLAITDRESPGIHRGLSTVDTTTVRYDGDRRVDGSLAEPRTVSPILLGRSSMIYSYYIVISEYIMTFLKYGFENEVRGCSLGDTGVLRVCLLIVNIGV